VSKNISIKAATVNITSIKIVVLLYLFLCLYLGASS